MPNNLLSNEELNQLIQKATIATTTGAQLSATQSEDFVNLMVEQIGVLQNMRVITDIATSHTVDGLDFGEPVVVAAAEATAPDAADVIEPDMPRLTLTPKKILAAIDISYDFLRKNIRRENAEQDLNAALAKRVGMDIVNIVFNGDTALAATSRLNKALRVMDGLIKKAKAHGDVNDFVVAASPTYIGANSEFGKALRQIPKEYRDNREALRHYCSVDTLDTYEDEIADRPTGAADAVLFGANGVSRHKRVEIITPFGFANNTHLTTIAQNLVVGFGRNMELYRQEQHRSQKLELTLVADIDAGFVHGKAISFGEQA